MSWFHQALRSRRRWTRRSMRGSHCAVERARAGARYGIVITLPPLPFLLAPHCFISLSCWPPPPPLLYQPVLLAPLRYQPVLLAPHCFSACPAGPPLLYQPVLLAPHCFISLSCWSPIALSACPAAPPPPTPHCFISLSSWPSTALSPCRHCLSSMLLTALSACPAGPSLLCQPVQLAPHCFISLPALAVQRPPVALSSCQHCFISRSSWPFSDLSACPAGPSLIYQPVQLAPHCFISRSRWPLTALSPCLVGPSEIGLLSESGVSYWHPHTTVIAGSLFDFPPSTRPSHYTGHPLISNHPSSDPLTPLITPVAISVPNTYPPHLLYRSPFQFPPPTHPSHSTGHHFTANDVSCRVPPSIYTRNPQKPIISHAKLKSRLA